MIRPPVVIFNTPLSGSSAIAHIFHCHGLWLGDTSVKRGYDTGENADINRRLLPLICKDGRRDFVMANGGSRDTVRELLEDIVPADTDWAWKGSIDYWPIFFDLIPDSKYVFVQRPIEMVAMSKERRGEDTYEDALAAADRHYMKMLYHSDAWRIPFVYADEVIGGNHESIRAAFEHCGLAFDPALAAEAIAPALFHR